jgi:hypothetical protein
VEPGPSTLPLGGKRVRVHEWEDGRVEIHAGGGALPYSRFDQNPNVTQGVATGVGGSQFHRDHRYPGTRPVILGRFFALTAA